MLDCNFTLTKEKFVKAKHNTALLSTKCDDLTEFLRKMWKLRYFSLSPCFCQKFREINVFTKSNKLLKNWFHEIFCPFLLRENFSFLHTHSAQNHVYIRYSQINQPVNWFDEILLSYYTLCGKMKDLLKLKQISSNQLFSNFFSKNFIFTKFLPKMCDSKFP